jgi:hypothetical protein
LGQAQKCDSVKPVNEIATLPLLITESPTTILNRYIMFGRGICEKYQSRDEKFILKIGIFRKYPSQT